MKLMGQRKKDGESKSNSARTSPSKLADSEFMKNSLLASNSGVSGEEVSSVTMDNPQIDHGLGNVARVRTQQFQKTDNSNSSSVHPLRSIEDENLDYDSNASSSSFEFHKNERSTHNAISRTLLRPMSSKWNDAEKWIINRQNMQSHNSKNSMQNRSAVINGTRVAPDSASSTKPVDICQPALQTGVEKFSFVPSDQASGANELIDRCHESKDLKEVDSNEDTIGEHGVRSVSMRDMGTEMTPIPSQEPSMTSTPIGATTPLRSPNSSIPSTPRGRAPTSSPMADSGIDCSKELSEQELKLKTRKEIVELGVQLGKMNIAAWASKEDKEKHVLAVENNALAEESLRIEFERRAVAWEDAEKSKHNARFKSEEIKIQAWESQQKAKLEAEMRRIEAQVEERRAQAQAKRLKKMAMARQKAEEKRAKAEVKKNIQAEKAAAQAEYIRQTGRIPPSPYICCGWS